MATYGKIGSGRDERIVWLNLNKNPLVQLLSRRKRVHGYLKLTNKGIIFWKRRESREKHLITWEHLAEIEEELESKEE